MIPEDSHNDHYILEPIFNRLFQDFGKRRARIRVCTDPRLRGVHDAMALDEISNIVERYVAMTDIFILCVDRDGDEHRRQGLDLLESKLRDKCVFLAENAWEEIETWVLAGLNLPSDWRWADVRAEVHVKERYFQPLVAIRGLSSDSPGGGRKVLGEEASHRINAIRQKCREDFDALAQRIEAAVLTP